MARKIKGEVKTDAAANATMATEREELMGKVAGLVKKYNESAEFAEYKTMKKLDGEIAEAVAKYTELAECECFNELKREANPMAAAAMRLSFTTIKVVDKKQDGGGTVREVGYTEKYIDPLRLAKKYDATVTPIWAIKAERLNVLLSAAAGKGLGFDPKEIMKTAAMSDKAGSTVLPKEGDMGVKANLLANVQAIVDDMIGPGNAVLDTTYTFMRETHTKAGRGSNVVACANVKSTRQRLLAVCKSALTGEACWMLDYKKAKAK